MIRLKNKEKRIKFQKSEILIMNRQKRKIRKIRRVK